ncbi:amino acid adenylation domain-containing protein [Legionella sp. km772]|uniref:amino acid adenylation domain-containing protein n=1 Tax=Legionella sp. km772 TaxID=2498111 RepID=UPI0013150AAE|nr:amino acid adenylation domain-containing protein [Legionella sp. km772]
MDYYNLGLFFSDVAKENKAKTALRYADKTLNFAELLDWTERLSGVLLHYGIQQGDVIAIASTKQELSYTLMLAALKLGIAYVNIDLNAPAVRNHHILKLAQVSYLFYDQPSSLPKLEELINLSQVNALELTKNIASLSPSRGEKLEHLMKKVDGSSIAYIMFTSGSTGIPKGVAVTHQNLIHFINWGKQHFQINPNDNFAQLSPLYFDNSVFDFYVALFSGASLSPISRELLNQPYELVPYINKMACTIWFSVPSLLMYLTSMKAIAPQCMPHLRHIVFGGEGYPKTELKRLYDFFASQARLTNVYGPTECTCICSAYSISESDFMDLEGLPPLGTLNINFDYLILDEQNNESAQGELCLIGPNVAAGYFNDLNRTKEVFITLTDSKHFMKRMYKTGDLVKEEEGILYFIGRKDNQIKHMGYRIELEEIENAMAKLPHINQAAVVYQRANASYGKLIGFVASSESPEEQYLLNELEKLLPNYMIPSRIVVKKVLPKNSNGKVDRQQLMTEKLYG